MVAPSSNPSSGQTARPSGMSAQTPGLPPSPFQQQHGIDLKNSKVGKVYVGPDAGGDQWVDIDVLKGQTWMLSEQTYNKMLADAQEYKGWSKPISLENFPSFYNEMVDLAYQIQTQTGQMIVPQQAYDWLKRRTGRTGQAEAAAGGGRGGGGPVTTTSKVVNLTDPTAARGLIDNALSQYLGRRPDEQEYAAFQAALNRSQKENPQIQTTTRTRGGSTSVVKGGMEPTQFAQEYARGQQGVAEVASATSLLDTFLKAVVD